MNLVVAYDGSKPSKKALNKAIELAPKLGDELTLLSVTEPVCPVSIHEKDCAIIDEKYKQETKEILNSVKGEIEKAPLKIKTAVRHGKPEEEIIKFAEDEKADMVFIGSRGRHGAKKYFLGSVSLRVSEYSPCSVLIAK